MVDRLKNKWLFLSHYFHPLHIIPLHYPLNTCTLMKREIRKLSFFTGRGGPHFCDSGSSIFPAPPFAWGKKIWPPVGLYNAKNVVAYYTYWTYILKCINSFTKKNVCWECFFLSQNTYTPQVKLFVHLCHLRMFLHSESRFFCQSVVHTEKKRWQPRIPLKLFWKL